MKTVDAGEQTYCMRKAIRWKRRDRRRNRRRDRRRNRIRNWREEGRKTVMQMSEHSTITIIIRSRKQKTMQTRPRPII